MPAKADHKDNRAALLIMAFSMLSLSIADIFIRLTGADMPVGQILVVRGVMLVAMLIAIMHWQGIGFHKKQLTEPWSMLRGIFELGAATCFFTAIQLLPLAVANTIAFIYPILLPLASIILFGEKARPLRLMAVVIGFGGLVLVALNNQGMGNDGSADVVQGMTSAMIFPLLVAFFLVGRDLVTRKIDTSISPITVILTTSVLVTLGGFPSLIWEEWIVITPFHWFCLAMAAATVAASFIAYVMAIRLGEMASIAPSQYLLIVWASMWGFLIWGEVPNLGGLMGAGLIIAAGLIILWCEGGAKGKGNINRGPPALPLE